MRTVLVLHPGHAVERQALVRQHRPLLEELGVQLLLAADDVDDGDRALFAETLALPPPERVAEAWERLREWLPRRRVDAVLAQSEPAVLLGSLVARALGVKGLAPEAALRTVSKVHTRRALQAAQVSQPRFTLARTAADARSFAAEVGYPIVLKAIASVRSRLVTLVEYETDVAGAVERVLGGLPRSIDVQRLLDFADVAGLDLGCDPAREFLVEEFAPGAPVETDGLVVGARPRSFGVLEQVLTAPPRFFLEGYLLPSDRPQRELERIERVSEVAIAALGLTDTGYSIELRWDGAQARLIEVNGRLGWDEGFGALFATILGAHPMFLTLQLALGMDPAFARDDSRRAALAYQSCFSDSVVRRVPGAAEVALLEREGVVLGVSAHAGQRKFAPPNAGVEPHLAFALAMHRTSSRAAYAVAHSAVERLRFELAPADGPR